jgi:hypothetical protein
MCEWQVLEVAKMGGISSASSAISIFLLSLLGIPATYFVDTAQTLHGEKGLLVSGVVSLVTICLLTYLALSHFKQPKDWIFYGKKLVKFFSYLNHLICFCHVTKTSRHNSWLLLMINQALGKIFLLTVVWLVFHNCPSSLMFCPYNI